MRRWSAWALGRFGLILAMGSLSPRIGEAQSPGVATKDALRAALGGSGSCWSDMEIRDTTISYFPGVRFIRGYCTAEHGTPISGIVALDSDSVLYLFTSTQALDLLLLRHPIPTLDSASVLDFAPVALELSGHANAYSRRVATPKEGGPELARALSGLRGRPWLVLPAGTPRPVEWQVFFGRTEPGFDRKYAYFTEIWIDRTGRTTVMRDSLVTALPSN